MGSLSSGALSSFLRTVGARAFKPQPRSANNRSQNAMRGLKLSRQVKGNDISAGIM